MRTPLLTCLRTTVLTGSTQGYECFPSEGGHAEFAPHNELEAELLEFLSIKLGGRVSVERVVSGTGIPNVRKTRFMMKKR